MKKIGHSKGTDLTVPKTNVFWTLQYHVTLFEIVNRKSPPSERRNKMIAIKILLITTSVVVSAPLPNPNPQQLAPQQNAIGTILEVPQKAAVILRNVVDYGLQHYLGFTTPKPAPNSKPDGIENSIVGNYFLWFGAHTQAPILNKDNQAGTTSYPPSAARATRAPTTKPIPLNIDIYLNEPAPVRTRTTAKPATVASVTQSSAEASVEVSTLEGSDEATIVETTKAPVGIAYRIRTTTKQPVSQLSSDENDETSTNKIVTTAATAAVTEDDDENEETFLRLYEETKDILGVSREDS